MPLCKVFKARPAHATLWPRGGGKAVGCEQPRVPPEPHPTHTLANISPRLPGRRLSTAQLLCGVVPCVKVFAAHSEFGARGMLTKDISYALSDCSVSIMESNR